MADEPSLGEVVRRLDRVEGQQTVSPVLYGRDRAEMERRVSELERELDSERAARLAAVEVERAARQAAIETEHAVWRAALEAERAARKEADRLLREQLEKQADKQSGNWRQALYGGLVPGLIVLVSVAVQTILATRGGK